MTPRKPSRQCRAKANSTGRRCQVAAVIGLTVCWRHGGANRRAQRKSTVAKELAAWGFTDQRDDPGDVLLKLVTLSSRRVAFYAGLLEQQYEAAAKVDDGDPDASVTLPRGVAALIGHKYGRHQLSSRRCAPRSMPTDRREGPRGPGTRRTVSVACGCASARVRTAASST